MIDEGYIKFDARWTETPPLAFSELDELIRWRRALFAAGLIGHYAHLGVSFGNLSARIGDGNQFLISGTQTGHIENAGPERFALVTDADVGSNTVVCQGPLQASSESMTHAAIYEVDPGIRAIAHVHDAGTWSRVLNVIPTTGETTAYGTPEMATEFARLIKQPRFRRDGIAAMGGHEAGLIAVGANVRQAATRILDFSETVRNQQTC